MHSALPLSPTLHPATSSKPSSPHYPDVPSTSPRCPPAASGALQLSFPSFTTPTDPDLPHIFLLTRSKHQPSPATASSNYDPTEFPHPLNARKQHLLCARQRLKPSWLNKSTVSHRLTSEVGTSTVFTLQGRRQAQQGRAICLRSHRE